MISTLTISGFRGISEEIPFQFGSITLLAGRNGLGKTTVFDAIDWCLFGSSWRLGFDTESIRNIYHPHLDPIVRMQLRLPDRILSIERTRESAFLDGSRISDRDLVETLMTDPGTIAAYTRDVESRLRRVVYLSQDEIRALIHPENAQERSSLFQALLGVPNASAMQSGVRRISDHFKQREQEMRLHLGQLRMKRDELRTALQDATGETIDTIRIISEANEVLKAPSSLTIEELTQRSRRELDALSAESIQLDEGLSAIAAFRRRREADNAEAEKLSKEIESREFDEAQATAANEEVLWKLASSRQANEESAKYLVSALELQRRLQDSFSAHRRVEELATAEEEAVRALRAAQEAAERLRTDLERLRRLSDDALDRRRAAAVKRSDLEAARDRSRMLRDRQREEADLIARASSLTDEINKLGEGRDSLRLRLREAQEEMNRRREEYDSLSKTASSSDALESLLRQAVSMLPEDLSECPLCGCPFMSRQELLQHISKAREQYALTSDALSRALAALHAQQEVIGKLERELRDADEELATMGNDKSQCDESLQRVREVIATFPTQIETPTDQQFESADDELKSIDEELKRLKDDIDDRTTRLSVAQDDVSRASARLEMVKQQITEARQNVDLTLLPSDLERQAASAADATRLADKAAREAAAAEKAATEDQLAKEAALTSIRRRLSDLRSQLFSTNERATAETATLLAQVAAQAEGITSADEVAEWLEKRRIGVTSRLVTMKRIWSELITAGAEERAKAIRVQCDAIEKELATTQSTLDMLLKAKSRFTLIADELRRTAESEGASALRLQQQAIQECFAAIYPHGHLNKVGGGDDPLGELRVTDKLLAHGVEPTTYLSTGQANVLSLSIFMGIALRQRLLRTGVVCLDEPIQHLDDLHFLGFVSLLKRVGLSRQVLLSTADANVAEIITRQMESSWAELPTDFIRYEWNSFDPKTGPQVAMRTSARQAVA
jgi:DNA repair exonuclease SbcCD ATPase subunit